MFLEGWFEKKIKNVWLRYNVQYFGLGIVIGTLLNILFRLIDSGDETNWRGILMTYIISILITLSITNIYIVFSYFIKYRFSSPVINIVVSYLVMIFGVIAGTEISLLFVSWLYQLSFKEIDHWGNLKFNLGIGFIVTTIMYLYRLQRDSYNLKISEKEVQLLKLSELKIQAELKTLQARINPHFLYNALNSITSLIHDEPAKAEEMTIKLSKLFRYSLNTQEANFASIKEELEIVETYLEIEKVRFQDRINFEIISDPELNEVLIPRFLLQPLVENALKHGLNHTQKDGLLRIKIEEINDHIKIYIHDNGEPFPTEMLAGYGLQSTNDKLILLYGADWKMNYTNSPEKHMEIIIPKKEGI